MYTHPQRFFLGSLALLRWNSPLSLYLMYIYSSYVNYECMFG
nr:MAG TPA: hypothetical protein [Caudoviricetes sp.]